MKCNLFPLACCRLRSADIPLEERSEDPEKKITYLMPAMDFHQRRHDSVLAEAANMGLVLDGKKVLPFSPPNLPLQYLCFSKIHI